MLIARLTMAGGLCAAVTRAVTSPIELRKTRAQAASARPVDQHAHAAAAADAAAAAPPSAAAPTTATSAGSVAADNASMPIATTGPADPHSDSIWLGVDASFFTGLGLGAGSFGTFELLKRTLPPLAASTLGPAAPADLATPILLTACLAQAAMSAVCASPFETAKARIMSGGGRPGAPTTLAAALQQIMTEPPANSAATAQTAEDGGDAAISSSSSGGGGGDGGGGAPPQHVQMRWDAARLWDGLPALLLRELPFGVTKLLVFAATQDALLTQVPAARERPVFSLAVSLIAGLASGLMSALVSHPADTVVTRLATGGFGRDARGALQSVLADADPPGDRQAQARVLYAGVSQRCASQAIIVMSQFVLFDGLRAAFAVSKDDLSLVLDIFKDRLDFYEGWDTISGAWVDAIDNLDSDLDLYVGPR